MEVRERESEIDAHARMFRVMSSHKVADTDHKI